MTAEQDAMTQVLKTVLDRLMAVAVERDKALKEAEQLRLIVIDQEEKVQRCYLTHQHCYGDSW